MKVGIGVDSGVAVGVIIVGVGVSRIGSGEAVETSEVKGTGSTVVGKQPAAIPTMSIANNEILLFDIDKFYVNPYSLNHMDFGLPRSDLNLRR